MTIKITYKSIDGFRKVGSFKKLESARAFAIKWVGEQDVEGGSYAVSFDGVGKVTWQGCTRRELFGTPELAKQDAGSFMAVREGNHYQLYAGKVCPANLFATAYEAWDNITGDNYEGWTLRGIGYGYEDWMCGERRYATLRAALVDARSIFTAYMEYCNEESRAEQQAESAWLRHAEMGSVESQMEEDYERMREAAWGGR